MLVPWTEAGAERIVGPPLPSRKCVIVPLPSKLCPMPARPVRPYQNSL